jgi:hypothetical protein
MQSPSIIHDSTPDTYLALAGGERLLIWACRTWAAWAGAGRCPLCPIEHEFGRLGIADAASALHALMCATATYATRPFQVHGPGCRMISADEVRLVRAAAAAQQDQLEPALAHLQEWLPLAQANLAFNALRAFAVILENIGLELPVRSRKAVLESGIDYPDVRPVASHTLH